MRQKITIQRGATMNRMLLSLGFVAASLLLMACSELMPLNNAPPTYIKQVTAYKEGSDGLFIYIILADSSGAMTTASGTLELHISETRHDFSLYGGISERNKPLFSTRVAVPRSSFRRAKVGLGAFEHEVIMFPVGRISYSSFSKRPSEMTGKVQATFATEDGRSLKGEETIVF
jgi:hypothetical protein